MFDVSKFNYLQKNNIIHTSLLKYPQLSSYICSLFWSGRYSSWSVFLPPLLDTIEVQRVFQPFYHLRSILFLKRVFQQPYSFWSVCFNHTFYHLRSTIFLKRVFYHLQSILFLKRVFQPFYHLRSILFLKRVFQADTLFEACDSSMFLSRSIRVSSCFFHLRSILFLKYVSKRPSSSVDTLFEAWFFTFGRYSFWSDSSL